MISESLREHIEKLLHQSVKDIHSVSGGSINRAAKIITHDNNTFFLKWNSSTPTDMFPKEKKGLDLLRSAKSRLRIPEVINHGSTPDGTDFLIIEYIQEGSVKTDSAQRFGRQLAMLHKNEAEQYGLDHDNYIGKLPQANTKHHGWVDFFIKERLQPQLSMAISSGKIASSITQNFQQLYKKLPDIVANEPASLLHGDLWSGNYFYDANGEPVIYDPAVYY